MSSPIPPPPAGSQPSYVPPNGEQNPYAPEAGSPAGQAPYAQPADQGQAPFTQPADQGQPAYGQAPYGQPAQYGQAPYGQAPGQPYGQPYGGPGFPGDQRPSSGLAIAALVVGAISLIVAWVPVINVISIIGGIVAVVLGVVALRKVGRGAAGGKGMAIAGTVLGGVSLVAAIIVNIFLGAAISEAVDAAESAASAAPSAAPADPADEQTVDTEQPAEPADAEAPAAAGGLLPLGQPAEVGDYTVTVNGLNLDADDAIAQADEFNPPAEGQYVIADVSVVYNGTDEGNPWMDLSYIFTGTDAEEYDDGTCMAIEKNSVVNVPTLAAGDAADYEVCMDVPAEAIAGGTFAVTPFLSFDQSERATWAID